MENVSTKKHLLQDTFTNLSDSISHQLLELEKKKQVLQIQMDSLDAQIALLKRINGSVVSKGDVSN